MTYRKEGIGEGIILLEVQPLGLLKMVSSCTALREWGLGGRPRYWSWMGPWDHKSWSVTVPYSSNAHGAGTGVSPTYSSLCGVFDAAPSYHSWAD